MTRTGPTKSASPVDSNLRLGKARAYLEAARNLLALLRDGEMADPIVSTIANSAIAYSDALTARYAGKFNKQDHRAAPKLLRDALGKELPREQETCFSRILGHKDEAQYGTRSKRRDEAELLLKDLERFAAFAETLLSK